MKGLLRSEPRDLMVRDLIRARIGKRFYEVRLSLIPDHLKYKKHLQKWVEDIEVNLEQGRGLYLHGGYGQGKTSAAAILCKAVVAHGATALMVTGTDLKRALIEKPRFDAFETVPQRMKSVDLLVIDDPELGGETAWSKAAVEEVVRARSNSRLATVIATNLSPTAMREFLGEGLLQVLQESAFPVEVKGKNWRDESRRELQEKYTQ